MPRKLDDWIESFMEFTENSEPPKTYKKWTAISLIASVLQRKCVLKWGPMNFYPNMYIVLVGPSGRCRKGTVMSIGHKFLRDIGIPLAAEATTREALIIDLENADIEEAFAAGSDGTMYKHNSLTIFSPELIVFLGYNNLQLISDLTDWYDCRTDWKYRTKNSGSNTIDAVYVNILGATTPDLIRSAFPQDAVGGGLSSRMIFVSEYEKSKTIPYPFLTDQNVELGEKLAYDLEDIYTMRGEYQFDQGFMEAWGEWYTRQSEEPPFSDNPKFEGYVNRRGNHVLKLCMIISASESKEMILEEGHIKRAIEYLEEVEKKMPTVFFGHGTADNADVSGRILRTVSALGDKGIHYSQLMRTYMGYVESADDLSIVLRKLEQSQFIRMDRETQIVYAVNR